MSNKKTIKQSAIYDKIAVVSAKEAWDVRGDKPKLNNKYQFVGKIDKEQPHIIRNVYKFRDKANKVVSFKDDFCHLNNCTKKEIIDKLYKSDKVQKVYLVLDDKKGNKKQ